MALFMGVAGKAERLRALPSGTERGTSGAGCCRKICARPAVSVISVSWGYCACYRPLAKRSVIEEFVQQTLGPMIEPRRKHPHSLLETLDALLHENGNALQAARRLKRPTATPSTNGYNASSNTADNRSMTHFSE